MLYFHWPLWVEFSIGKRYLFSEIPTTFCTQEGEAWCCWQLSRYLFAQLLSSWSKGGKFLMHKEGVEKVKAYRHSFQDWMNRHTVLVHYGQYKKKKKNHDRVHQSPMYTWRLFVHSNLLASNVWAIWKFKMK